MIELLPVVIGLGPLAALLVSAAFRAKELEPEEAERLERQRKKEEKRAIEWLAVLGVGAALYVGFSLLMAAGAMGLLLLGPFGAALVLGGLSSSGKSGEQRYYGKYEV